MVPRKSKACDFRPFGDVTGFFAFCGPFSNVGKASGSAVIMSARDSRDGCLTQRENGFWLRMDQVFCGVVGFGSRL